MGGQVHAHGPAVTHADEFAEKLALRFPNISLVLQDDSTTVALVKAGYPENEISSVTFMSTYSDTSADGPPGMYTLTYACQFSYNPLVQLDPGLTANPYK